MPSVFTLIGESWNFCRKQPALSSVGFWLLFLPLTGIKWCVSFIQITQQHFYTNNNPAYFVACLCLLPLGALFMWGIACVLLIGSRLLAAKAGRSRTSFRAVRTEAKAFLVPLILTSMLQKTICLVWILPYFGLLLLSALAAAGGLSASDIMIVKLLLFSLSLLGIPATIYYVRTVFFGIIIIQERIEYRAALERSKHIIRGHFGKVFFKILFLSIALFASVDTLISIIMRFMFSLAGILAIDVLDAALTSAAFTLFVISTILLYDALRPDHAVITNTKIKTVKRKKKMFA